VIGVWPAPVESLCPRDRGVLERLVGQGKGLAEHLLLVGVGAGQGLTLDPGQQGQRRGVEVDQGPQARRRDSSITAADG
jgi:hypothetical protein